MNKWGGQEEQRVLKNTKPIFTCHTCNVSINCTNLMEAEQRARIHLEHTGQKHKVTWELIDENGKNSNAKIGLNKVKKSKNNTKNL